MSDVSWVTMRRSNDVHWSPYRSRTLPDPPLSPYMLILGQLTENLRRTWAQIVAAFEPVMSQMVVTLHDLEWRLLPLDQRIDRIFAEGEARIMARIAAAFGATEEE